MTRKWWVLSAVACGTFMATLDSSIVNIALPTLTKELSVDLEQVKWVVVIYLLVITCLVLPFGRLSDLKGRKLIFQLGYLIFTIGSAFCSIAGNLPWLVFFRAFQAIGASMLMANGPAIITRAFLPRERGAALGTLAMVVSAGLVSGPSLGGYAISHLGWRSIFWINIPIGILGIMLVHFFVKSEFSTRVSFPFDWAGAIIQSILLVGFLILFDPPFVAISGSRPFPVSRWVIAAFLVLLFVAFIKIEKEVKAPIFDLSLLKERTFWTANLASFLTFVSYSSVSVLMPFFLEEVLQLPPKGAGLYMSAVPLTIFAVAPISGRLSDRFGSHGLSFAGALIGALGLFVMSGSVGKGISELNKSYEIVLYLCTIGFAMGLFQSPNNAAIMGSVPLNKLGVASALLATVRNLGLVTGTGLATALFSWRLTETGNFVTALHVTFFVAAWIGVAATIAALGKRGHPEEDKGFHQPSSRT